MKTISLILLGSILTIGIQFMISTDISFISSAEAAGNNKPCKLIYGDMDSKIENQINNLYRFGYRVKGVGGGGTDTVVMCKG